jgi:outer membrane protein OmpA-like peptidoglycan-associated protein
MHLRIAIPILVLLGCGAPSHAVRLERVVLYQSGIGYFEREGRVEGTVRLSLGAHEIDDALTTLTVVDPERPDRSPTPSVIVPRERAAEGTAQTLAIDVGEHHERGVVLAYAAPTSAWRASYRLVLPHVRGDEDGWLQAWAVVDNTSAEDWRDVELTLATDAPLSFAVDLRTPRLVSRPDVTGYVAPPVALGPILSENTSRRDDGDGIPLATDRCPDEPEDFDGWQDADGCPDPDQDGDGIADELDRCPSDAEGYNGLHDDDGCPDVGRVVISESEIRILESVSFAPDGAVITPAHEASLNAVVAALRGHPEITRVEVQGHADGAEDDPWRLSADRVARVRASLIDRGIDGARLIAQAYGDSQPIGDGERNRRVTFRVTADETPHEGAVRREAIERSARGTPLPQVSTGGTRFSVGRRVSVPAGTSAMVTILNRAVIGEDVLLYRVDPNAPESALHPFRAARLVNQSGVDLVPGPISLFARGEIVGQGLLGALHAGENAFVPYALDRSTSITVEREEEQVPARVLSLSRGALHVERTAIVRARYRVEAGHHAPARLFVRHARAVGYEPHALPPRSETSVDALVVPIPLEPGADGALVIEERRAARAVVRLADDLDTDITPYLDGSTLDPANEAALRQLLTDRDALRRLRERAVLLRDRLGEHAMRAEELRRSILALDERGGRSSADVRRQITAQLAAATRDAEAIAVELATNRAEETQAVAHLRQAAQELTIGE